MNFMVFDFFWRGKDILPGIDSFIERTFGRAKEEVKRKADVSEADIDGENLFGSFVEIKDCATASCNNDAIADIGENVA